MNYRVILTPTARIDLHETTRWIVAEHSPAKATQWLNSLLKTIQSLERLPHRCPRAAESENFAREIRELLHGRAKLGKYRILFEIRDDTVYVLYVRHSARDELQP